MNSASWNGDPRRRRNSVPSLTATLARQLFPGKRNNLDALCDRYQIDNSKRLLHGALLDAEILSDVYLAMTGGQTSLAFSADNESSGEENVQTIQRVTRPQSGLRGGICHG